MRRLIASGSAAAAGAKAGAAVSVGSGAQLAAMSLSEPLGVLLAPAFLAAGIVMAPVAAIVGAGVGVGAAHPEAEIEAAQANMTAALEAAKPADAIRARVVAFAEEQAARLIYDCGQLGSLEACRQKAPEPVAVVLALTVSAPYFEVEGAITPDLRLLLSADPRSSAPTAVMRCIGGAGSIAVDSTAISSWPQTTPPCSALNWGGQRMRWRRRSSVTC